jgi:hypothetical protein
MKRSSLEELLKLRDLEPPESCAEIIRVSTFDAIYWARSKTLMVDWVVETMDEGKMVYTTLCGLNIPGEIAGEYGSYYGYTHYGSRQQTLEGGLRVLVDQVPNVGATAYLLCVVYDISQTNRLVCNTDIQIDIR